MTTKGLSVISSQFNVLKTNALAAVTILLTLYACGDKSANETSNSQNQSPKMRTAQAKGSPPNTSKPTVSIDAMGFAWALVYGADTDGKKKEVYLLEMQDAGKIILRNSFVYGKDTSSESEWLLLIGDNKPRIICQQKTKEAKMVIANMDKKLSGATVEGEYSRFSSDKLYLTNCAITAQ